MRASFKRSFVKWGVACFGPPTRRPRSTDAGPPVSYSLRPASNFPNSIAVSMRIGCRLDARLRGVRLRTNLFCCFSPQFLSSSGSLRFSVFCSLIGCCRRFYCGGARAFPNSSFPICVPFFYYCFLFLRYLREPGSFGTETEFLHLDAGNRSC